MVVGWFFRVYGYARLNSLFFGIRQRHPAALSPVTAKEDDGRDKAWLEQHSLTQRRFKGLRWAGEVADTKI